MFGISSGVAAIVEKMVETWFRLFLQVEGRKVNSVVRRVDQMRVVNPIEAHEKLEKLSTKLLIKM